MKIPGQVLCTRRPHRLLGSAARAEGAPKSDRKGRARNAIAGLGFIKGLRVEDGIGV